MKSAMTFSSDTCELQAHRLGDATVIRFTGRQVVLDEQSAPAVGQ
jgi:hypothetical protein